MKTLKLNDSLTWVGVQDPDLRVFDIIMETKHGTSYNSFVLQGSEKNVLFETAKYPFLKDYLEKVETILSLDKIDYIVVNHTEPDHAGSIEQILQINPKIKIIGTPCALNFLKEIVNQDFYGIPVKDNETLSIGNKTLRFMHLPNLHWPDTMYTYIEEDQVLITCDSFGSHYSFEEVLLSKVTYREEYMEATKYYFDCIMGPFKPFVLKALDRIEKLDIKLIGTGHGPIVDVDVKELLDAYRTWSKPLNPFTKKTVAIPYVSAYGYTASLAENIKAGIIASGDIDVFLYDLEVVKKDVVEEACLFADGLLFGTPTIVQEALKPIWDLTTDMFIQTHSNKLAAAFGSYGWSGEGTKHITERLKQLRMKVLDPFTVRFKPSDNQLIDAFDYGYNFGCLLLNKPNDKKVETKKMKCLVCGAILDHKTEVCPVCGVEKDKFVEMSEENEIQLDRAMKILIVGNGIAAISAAESIRKRNQACAITMYGDESVAGYNRPMLTKALVVGFDDANLAIKNKAWYQSNRIDNHVATSVISIDHYNKKITLDDLSTHDYDALVLATGASCFIPKIEGIEHERVRAIRGLKDANFVHEQFNKVKKAVVIGGGVLGLEVAYQLRKGHIDVTVLELADGLMVRQLDEVNSKRLQQKVEANGIKVEVGCKIDRIENGAKVSHVIIQDDQRFEADLIIISCGISANTLLAMQADILVERAIVVDEHCQTNIDGIYACGDCAQFNSVNLGIWPEAVAMGKIAGANIAGEGLRYQPAQSAISFQGANTSLYAMGDVGKDNQKHYKIVEIKDDQRQVYETYYFTNNRFVGVILLGSMEKMIQINEDLSKNKSFDQMF